MGFNNISINILILTIVSTIGIDADKCLWPDNVCVPLHNCKAVESQLFRDDLTEAEKTNLQNMQCGYRNGTVFVCCKSSLPKPGVCGPFEQQSRISHGKIAGLNQFPWTALLVRKIDSELRYDCGGSLLNEWYVLTSAHCVTTRYTETPKIRKLYEVRLGEWNTTNSEPDQSYSSMEDAVITADPVLHLGVQEYIVHENYDRKKRKNDIALLKLDRNVQYTKYIKPICLPALQDSNVPIEDNSLFIMGWGATEEKRSSDVKRYAEITYVPKKKCTKSYREIVGYQFNGINDEHFCAGGKKDTCDGDSGGPVTVFDDKKFAFYIIGIVTYGATGCGNELPGIYTKISYYIEWIIQNMEH